MKGIIPRMIETIFSFVEEASETMEFLVKVSYIEIYMEKIRDLMARKSPPWNPLKRIRCGRGRPSVGQ